MIARRASTSRSRRNDDYGGDMNRIIVFAVLALVAGFAAGHYLWRGHKAPAQADGYDTTVLLKTIDARHATREFDPTRPIDDKTMGEIAWAAFGKNSHGTRTIPTAMNEQNLKVYAIRGDGVFLVDGEHLNQVSNKDLRHLFTKQDYMRDVPLVLLFAGSDKKYSPMHAGSSYQNVALYCASRGIGNVVRAYFDAPAVEKALGFKKGEFAIISQAIGWGKK